MAGDYISGVETNITINGVAQTIEEWEYTIDNKIVDQRSGQSFGMPRRVGGQMDGKITAKGWLTVLSSPLRADGTVYSLGLIVGMIGADIIVVDVLISSIKPSSNINSGPRVDLEFMIAGDFVPGTAQLVGPP